jgi:hypothetical protein
MGQLQILAGIGITGFHSGFAFKETGRKLVQV